MTDGRMVVAIRTSAGLSASFVLITAAEHVLQSRLAPATHRISEYATGSPGWLMSVGFAAWSLALLLLAVSAFGAPLSPRPVRGGVAAMLAVAALGAGVTAVFETGTRAGVVPEGHHLTTANHLHDLGSGVLALALWAAAVISLGLSDTRLRWQTTLLLATGLVASGLLSHGLLDLPGIRQRALVAVGCAWQLLLLGYIASRTTRSITRARKEEGASSPPVVLWL